MECGSDMRGGAFRRSEMLLGPSCMESLARARVIIFGVGGVGSWCAESLVRTGLKNLTIVDFDKVSESNCNRQLMATHSTVGKVKVEAMKERLEEISPLAHIEAINVAYNAETAESFHLEDYDYVIDAIDSLKDKVHLILSATALMKEKKLKFFSSMGAALRLDTTKVRVAEFWEVEGDGLARALRHRFKHKGQYPACKFKCVYSEELPLDIQEEEKGSLSQVTGAYGLTLASLVTQDMLKG